MMGIGDWGLGIGDWGLGRIKDVIGKNRKISGNAEPGLSRQ